MSADMRDRIAKVLDGLTADWDDKTHRVDAVAMEPTTPHALQAWPRWQNTVWLTRCTKDITWQVLVILPAGNVAATTTAAEALLDPARAALEQIGHVERAEPGTFQAQDSTTMPVLQYTVTTAAGTIT